MDNIAYQNDLTPWNASTALYNASPTPNAMTGRFYGNVYVGPSNESSNGTTAPTDIEYVHFCKWILYEEVDHTGVRIWDWLIFLPNLIFMLFLLVKFKSTKQKLKASTSPIFVTFYLFVVVNVVASLLRCLIAMLISASTPFGGTTDRVFWVVVRFFLLSTEISVLVFGLAFGHLDSRTSIRRVLAVTSFISLAYSICQGTLEIIAPDESFYIEERNMYVFSHGGCIFWFCTCLVCSIIYFISFVLPWTPCRRRIPLPTKRSFYIYAAILSFQNFIQSVGSLLFYYGDVTGLCIVDVTTYAYFTFFTPLVYWTFLAAFFSSSKSVIMFSYKAQIDDVNDETIDSMSASGAMHLPSQSSCSSLKAEVVDDFVYQQRGHASCSNQESSTIFPSPPFSPDSIHADRNIV